MYPLKFKPLYKERIWGGSRLQAVLGRKLPGSRIGESWELSCHKNGMSVVANGKLTEKTLAELLAEYPGELMGKSYASTTGFPLLIKAIDANDNLSVQVHPDDGYAYRVEQEAGKTEAWYVLEAKPDAHIIYGLKEGITSKDFGRAVDSDQIMDCLRVVPVKKGDMVYVPAGLVHALLEGVTVYEVQQSSDITYRIYDYGRVDENGKARELHTAKALDVIQFAHQPGCNFNKQAIVCPYFTMEKLQVDQELHDNTKGCFLIYLLIAGDGEIIYQGGNDSLTRGDTVLIPADLGEFRVRGNVEFLRVSTITT